MSKSEERRCSYCNTKEGEVRKVGNFEVELTAIEVKGLEKLACQACKIKVREVRKAIQPNSAR